MRRVWVKYGVGYGRHTMDLEFEDEATPEEIEEAVQDAVMEQLDWSYEIEGGEDGPR